MNDPYMPLEARLNLTGRALEVMAQYRFPVHVITKSDLVLKDLATLTAIKRVYAAVSFSVSTADDDLAKKLEPGAPPPSARFRAMAVLAGAGILTGVTMMPILPFITDTAANITHIVTQAQASGASYIIPWFGMTLRDRQRSYYYHQLDRHFPGLRQRYERTFGQQYQCNAANAPQLQALFQELCQRYGLATRIPRYTPPAAVQPRLF
jgi:DNA repair photolyase